MITLSLQTKLGEKVSILCERVSDLWNGTNEAEKKKQAKAAAAKKAQGQPVQAAQNLPPPPVNPGQSAMNQALNGGGSYGTTDISSLPNAGNGQIAILAICMPIQPILFKTRLCLEIWVLLLPLLLMKVVEVFLEPLYSNFKSFLVYM